jgi:WD40 repeat protein
MRTVFFFLFLGFGLVGLRGQVPRLVVPIGHTSAVNSVAFSPDGKYILTGSDDNTAKLWQLDGREVRTFYGHKNRVQAVAFSPDGRQVLTGSRDSTAKLWTLAGQEVRTFSGHTNYVEAVAFSPDGRQVLTGSGDHTAKLWTLEGQEIRTFSGHTSYIEAVAFSPDGRQVLTGSYDQTAKLWTLDGQKVRTFSGHTFFVSAVAFSPDGRQVLTGSRDKTAKLWTLDGQEVCTFSGHTDDVFAVAFSPDGRQVLTGSGDKTAKLWTLDGQEVRTFSGHKSNIFTVAFSPNGHQVLTGSVDKTAKLWTLDGKEVRTFSGHSDIVSAVAFSPNGRQVLTGSGDHTAKLWTFDGQEVHTFSGHSDVVSAVAFSPDGHQVLTGSWDKTAKLWTLDGKEVRTFSGHSDIVTAVSFSPDGRQVLTGSWDKTAKLWAFDGHKARTFSGHTGDVYAVAFSPDGQQVLAGSGDHTAKLWTLNGHEVRTFSGHTNDVYAVAFSPDGRQVLTGSGDNTAKLWTLEGQEIRIFSRHSDVVSAVAFSPDGRQVLTGSGDHTAKLWTLGGQQIRIFSGHTYYVSEVAFSPDGHQVLTGSGDNTTKLWNTESGQELATLIAIDSTDWVVTTPSGLFDASAGAIKLMYYVQGLELIELDQLKERYYEPGLLAKIMGFDQSELRNVAALNQVALYPEIKASIEKSQLAIQLTERSGGLGKLSLFINDKEVQEDINPKRLKTLSIDLNTFAKYYLLDTVNTIALRAYNQEGWLKSQTYGIAYYPPISISKKNIPSLYALSIGTSQYAGDHHLNLSFADLDAEALAKAIQIAGSALFGSDRTQVQTLTSVNNIASNICSKTNIQQAFKNIAAKAKPEDIALIFFSGHGLAYGPAEKEQFYYLTKDIGSEKLDDKSIREAYAISSDELTKWLTDIPAQKQVMIIDACNAGKVVESLAAVVSKDLNPSQIRALDRMKDRTGMFILTGSAKDKVSYEASQYGQGLLTYSLLQGMSGLALKDGKYVDVMTLFQYSRDQVPELAKGVGGIQTPVLAFPTGAASFDIGIAGPGVNIPVAQMKAVFIRNVFLDENFGDELRLVKALEEYFRKVTAKGAQAEMIYVDVNEYENGYSIRGTYGYEGDAVVVKGSLFKGKTILGKFEVTGKKSDVSGLVEGIVGKIEGMVK